MLREQLDDHGLTQVLHNLPAGNWAAGERGIAILPDRVAEFRDGVAPAIDYAKALDCRSSIAWSASRRRTPIRASCSETLVEQSALCRRRRWRGNGIRLLVEPINTLDIPGFFLNRHRAGGWS